MGEKKMFGVEYVYSDGGGSYDIFETLEDAEKYANPEALNSYGEKIWDKDCIPLFIFSADFNTEYIYQEEDKDGFVLGWNYEDYYATILGNYKIEKRLNKIPKYFVR